ncbi:MAG: transcription-repair coupling factor [Bacteroidetes bacterium]|nr:transcription-repair coupling factor [Bacteroidota bacterium]
MKNLVLDHFKEFESIKEIISVVKNNNQKIIPVSVFPGSSNSLTVKFLFENENQILILLPTVQQVNETNVEMNILGLGELTVIIDKFNSEDIQEKITDLNKREKFILITTYQIFKKKLPAKDELNKNTTTITTGGELTYDELVEYLNLLNYQQDKFTENPGDFAIRGSIIDFWSYSEKRPCRLEFDGDFLESIRYFDPESQRSSNRIETVTLASAIDTLEKEHSATIFDYLNKSIILAAQYELHNLFKENNKQKIEETIIPEITAEGEELDKELKEELFDNIVEEIREDNNESNILFNSYDELINQNVRWIIEDELGEYENRIKLGLNECPIINSNFELLFNLLNEFASKSNTIIITAENELQAKRLNDLLSDFKDELRNLLETGKVKIEVLAIKKGFIAKKEKLVLLTDYQIFNKPYRTILSTKKKYKKSRVKDFASMKRGDYVVHETFGIGQYVGLETIKIGQVEQESIKILYAEGGVVYVNLNYLGLVKKFSSQDKAAPKLSLLGSNEWKSTKKKVKAKIKEAAHELIKLYAMRKASQGYNFSPDTIWQKELEASFFYEDTPDQAKVTEDVKTDMESENPMDRLVCGDVGFGKTEIAVRAAFKAVNDGKQVGLLVPTTILAEQHYNTFKDRLSQFPVKVGVLSRFSTKKVQNETIDKLEAGQIDIIIGTHRLLSKDVKFKDLGLLIIDEEHRFGVMAKEKLRSIKANVDTLTLTATPIPRTLNLSLLGARDLSIIATPPPNRQPIYTKVDKFDIVNMRKWILEELKRDGQIYFVHDRVQSIDKIAAYVLKHIPELKIGVAHGQMRPAELEKVIYEFLNKKFHMLMATKIIESGLDIPNVNTIIINRADRFGLAELHQLRGRVGRSDRQAYAYLIVPSLNTISKNAVRRLQAIEEYTDLGGGFNLSMRDLEIRGAGNLLGTEQSGAIDTVGFEMYVKLLDEAVEELKQHEFKEVFKDLPKHIERSDPTIDTYFEIGIPKSFMPDQADRLSFYTALFSMLKISELDEIREEMQDRFGKLPVIIERLILTAVLRFHASYALFERIVVTREKISIILPKAEREDFYKNKFTILMKFIVENYSKEIQFKQNSDSMKFEMKNKYNSPEPVLEYLIEFCKKTIKLLD